MIHTTIKQETVDVLSRSALTSARAHYVSEAIKNTESSFEIIHILTSALIAADQEAEAYKKQCINLNQKNPVIPPIILDKNQIFMGIDVAGAGKDIGIYSDGSETK